MPRRDDIHKILVIGSGPIVIGQACEFDYSGTQGCKALREEGYEIVLINSNPATIMTDPEVGDRTYIEPIIPEAIEKIIQIERPDCLLPTLGGQTALNAAVEMAEKGVLDRYNVELIGAKLPSIQKAEDRELFKAAMEKIGQETPSSAYVSSVDQAMKIIEDIGFPAIIRPSYTLGGTGAGTAYNIEEYEHVIKWGLDCSPIHTVLVEESVLGWKEYELEVMRDLADNVVIICSIENFDPMGVHTGDSITVAPAQTLTDKEYQAMRDASIDIIREIGVETGGSNIQFAVDPDTGRMVVIEMNPRVSRSSALASKATGFPIAKIAAKLAVGYTLDEIPNDITRETPASFEPTIDYCVTKIPRWAFEKFAGSDHTLGTQMKSVGEAMSIGRTFKESLQKGLRSLETDRYGWGADGKDLYIFDNPNHPRYRKPDDPKLRKEIIERLRRPTPDRIFYIKYAFQTGMSVDEVHKYSHIDPWFLTNLAEIILVEEQLKELKPKFQTLLKHGDQSAQDLIPVMREAKQFGFSDRQLAYYWESTELAVRNLRKRLEIIPVYKTVDTCAAEFEAYTPYHYSTYESESEVRECEREKIIILGGGPNRIGQGIEFDYCCVHAVFALSEIGYETIMVNSNPETVSTDYDTADRLYFEPLTFEDVMNLIEVEKPKGIIVQFGGQTPLKLAVPLEKAGVPILGTSPDCIDLAEDRKRFGALIDQLGIVQPPNGTATAFKEAKDIARELGYPVLVRPSYVLGGRAMEIVYDEPSLSDYMERAVDASPEHPVLVDKYLEDAIEVDVDAVSDVDDVYIAGIMEHIEYAGVHSGDSACVIPPRTLQAETIERICRQTIDLAKALKVKGLMNIQYAVTRKDGVEKVYVLEVNPRASRTVPYVSKATGVPLAKIAAKVMAGVPLASFNLPDRSNPKHISVKEAVLPFVKFPGVDPVLGPEMRSTGEVMGIDTDFGRAYAKAQAAAGMRLPDPHPAKGKHQVILSVNDRDKELILDSAKRLVEMGFELQATEGTYRYLKDHSIKCKRVFKVKEDRPNIVDLMKNGSVVLVINTPLDETSAYDERALRRCAIEQQIPYVTTLSAARAAVLGIEANLTKELQVKALQDYVG